MANRKMGKKRRLTRMGRVERAQTGRKPAGYPRSKKKKKKKRGY